MTTASPPATRPASPLATARRESSGARDARLARRAQAHQALVDAAYAELEQRPWTEVTVDDLTRSAGLSRTAFYQHFIDRQELLLEILGANAAQANLVGNPWTTSGTDPITELQTTLADIVAMFVAHGRLLQAVRDASATDRAVAEAWTELVEGLIAITVDAITRDRLNGHTTVTDPEQMARALTRMDEAYLLDAFGRHPLADPRSVTTTLTRIWLNALYSEPPSRKAPTTRRRKTSR